MTAAAGLFRVDAVERLLEIVGDVAPAGVDVLDGTPAQPVHGSALIVGSVSGGVSHAAISVGRQRVDDRFAIEVIAATWTFGSGDLLQVRRQAQSLAGLVVDAVLDRPRLERAVGGSGLDGVVAAMIGRIDGPDCWRDAEGVGASATITVDVHGRIH